MVIFMLFAHLIPAFLQKESCLPREFISLAFPGFHKEVIAWLLWKLQENNLKWCLGGILLAPLSIKGLWSWSYLSCLWEPSLNQSVILTPCFSTWIPLRENVREEMWEARAVLNHTSLVWSCIFTALADEAPPPGIWPEQRLEARASPWPSKGFLLLEEPQSQSVGFASWSSAIYRWLKFWAPSTLERQASLWAAGVHLRPWCKQNVLWSYLI